LLIAANRRPKRKELSCYGRLAALLGLFDSEVADLVSEMRDLDHGKDFEQI
jgi:hypothetical protein